MTTKRVHESVEDAGVQPQKKFENLLEWLKKPWVQAILIGLVFTAFLLPKGVWLYQDDIFLAKNVNEAWQHLGRLFSSLEIADYYSTYFGYEATFFNIGRLLCYPVYLILVIITRDAGVAQWIFFTVFFALTFLVIRKLISFFSKNELGVLLGALFFVSSQWVLFFFTLPGFAFTLLGLPLFVISLFYVLNQGYRILPLLGLALSAYWMFGYQRLLIMYGAIAVVVTVFCLKHIWKQRRKVLLYIPVLLLLCLPLLFGIFTTYRDLSFGQSFNNYQDFFEKSYGPTSYTQQLKRNVLTAFHYSAPANSFLSVENSIFKFIFFVIAVVVALFVSWFLVKKSRWSWARVVLLAVYFGGAALVSLAHFVNASMFIKLTYKTLPFLANETANAKILPLLATAILIPFVLTSIKKRKPKLFFAGIVMLYIALSIVPLFSPSYKKSQIAFEEIPEEYRKEFFGSEQREPYIYYPNTIADWKDPYGLYFTWAGTAIEFNQNLKYRQLMSSNVRLTSLKQSKLFYALTRYPDSQFIKYFGAKNIVVFKDIQNSATGRFDYFSNEFDFVKSGSKTYSFLKKDANYSVTENNHFARFQSTSSKTSDYLLYSPSVVTDIDPAKLFLPTKKIFSEPKPLFMDDGAYNRPPETLLGNYTETITGNKNVHVDAKVFVKNRGKMLVKISNINPGSDFLLQLNQTFHPQWRIAVISKDEFVNTKCDSQHEYETTENSVCQAKAATIDLSALNLLSEPQISGRHFEGNVIGNDWLMVKEEYSKYIDKDGNLYIALYYKRQVFYQIASLVSLTLLGFGFAFACIQEISTKLRKKKWDNDFVEIVTTYLQDAFRYNKKEK